MVYNVMNYKKFYDTLNATRGRRKMAWNKVATRAGVTPSVLANFVRQYETENGAPKQLSLETFLALMQWLDLTDITEFLASEDDVN